MRKRLLWGALALAATLAVFGAVAGMWLVALPMVHLSLLVFWFVMVPVNVAVTAAAAVLVPYVWRTALSG